MANRDALRKAVTDMTSGCRTELVREYARDTEDLFLIALGFATQAEIMLVPLVGEEGAATMFERMAKTIRES